MLVVVFPLAADAQSRGRSQQSKGRSDRAEALARPDGLAEALLPAGARRHPSSRFESPRDSWGRWPQTERGWWRQQRFGRQSFGGFYAVPYTGFSPYAPAAPEAADERPAEVRMPRGVVRVDVIPSTGLEYFVDGVFIGSSSSLGTEFELNAGSRQIEVRARGYKSLVVERHIEDGRVTTLRGTLETIEQPQAPRSTGSRIMYVIPGCYVGNAKPVQAALPAGCDVRKLVTRGDGL